MEVRLLNLDPTQAEMAAGIHREIFGTAGWSAADWLALLGVPGAFGWLLISAEDEEPLAFLLGRHAGGEAEVLTLGVRDFARAQGLGRRLVELFQQYLREQDVPVAYLEVAESNLAALSLYRSLGFKKVGRRENYYATEEGRKDALVLRWNEASLIEKN